MNIEKKSVKEAGFCNFCPRGKRIDVPDDPDCWQRQHPYTHVYEISGNATSFRICKDCVDKLALKILDLPEIKKS